MVRRFHKLVGDGPVARRLIVAIILFSSVITLVTTGLQIVIEYRYGLSAIESDLERIRTGTLKSLTQSVWVADDDQIQVILEGLLRLPDIEHLAIAFNNAPEIAVGAVQSNRTVSAVYPLIFEYRERAVQIGTLTVIAGLDSLYARLFSNLLFILAGNAVKTFLVGGFVLVIFQSLVTRHLAQIASWARRLELGAEMPELTLSRRPHAGRVDELDDVVGAFNEMGAKLTSACGALKHNEEELEQRVRDRTRTLQEAQQEVVRRERSATLAEIAGTFGHELCHPLGVIQNSLFMIESQAPDPNSTTRRATARAKRSIRRCERLILDLQRYTLPSVPVPVSIDIDALIERLIAQHEVPSGVTIRHVPGPLGVEVGSDLDDLSYALAQLIENACDAISEGDGAALGGAVTVNTRVTGESVSISVCDTGSGIATDVLPRVFEPLFSTKGFGVGLGLPTVKMLAEQNEGQVKIASEPGRGTAVTLTLPLSESSKVTAA